MNYTAILLAILLGCITHHALALDTMQWCENRPLQNSDFRRKAPKSLDSTVYISLNFNIHQNNIGEDSRVYQLTCHMDREASWSAAPLSEQDLRYFQVYFNLGEHACRWGRKKLDSLKEAGVADRDMAGKVMNDAMTLHTVLAKVMKSETAYGENLKALTEWEEKVQMLLQQNKAFKKYRPSQGKWGFGGDFLLLGAGVPAIAYGDQLGTLAYDLAFDFGLLYKRWELGLEFKTLQTTIKPPLMKALEWPDDIARFSVAMSNVNLYASRIVHLGERHIISPYIGGGLVWFTSTLEDSRIPVHYGRTFGGGMRYDYVLNSRPLSDLPTSSANSYISLRFRLAWQQNRFDEQELSGYLPSLSIGFAMLNWFPTFERYPAR